MQAADLAQLRDFSRTNTYRAHGMANEADCIIGFSFGYRQELSGVRPGLSNERLASFIKNRLPRLPLLLQFEISDALARRKAELIIRTHRKPSTYLGSDEVAAQALEYMNSHGYRVAIVVAHPAMEARCDYECAALGIATVAPEGLGSIPYDEESAQAWTRNPSAWWQREEGVIALCYEKGLLKKPEF